MALNVARKGRLYVAPEVTYGTALVLAATDAIRHITAQLMFDPYGRVTSPEKKLSPGPVSRFDRRADASFSLEALLRPSGTLNTLGDVDPILEAAFGAKRNVTLSTTINDVAPTTTDADLTSVVGLAVGDAISIVVGGLKYARFITAIVASNVTWSPALPSAPVNTAVVKSGVTYNLTTDFAKSLVLAHYLPGFTRELRGAGVDQFTLNMDGTEEARFTAAGPAQQQITPAQAQPGAFTVVGGNPPTGMVGELYVGNVAYLHKSLELSMTNGFVVRNEEAGTGAFATEIYRAGRREITVSMDAFVETEATLYDLAEAGSETTLFRQNGRTEGNIIAVYAPRAEFKVPDTDDPDEASNWSFEATLLETVDGANDEFRIALL